MCVCVYIICMHTAIVGYHHFQPRAVTFSIIIAKFIVAYYPGQQWDQWDNEIENVVGELNEVKELKDYDDLKDEIEHWKNVELMK